MKSFLLFEVDGGLWIYIYLSLKAVGHCTDYALINRSIHTANAAGINQFHFIYEASHWGRALLLLKKH